MTLEARSQSAINILPDEDWWRGATIYQIYPRSFADSNGDGIGDLPGITARLDYIASLGVDAIWLSPFFTSPMHDFGYDVADYRGVDPIFGTIEDFDLLLERAHALGLRVIIDQVYSHTSDEHDWFQSSRSSRTDDKADWYVWADAQADGSPPSNWQSVFGGPSWTWDARRGQYYLHNFLPQQPDLNVHNPAVRAALMDTMRFWLDKGVDGIRLDAVNFMMHDPDFTDNPPVQTGEGKRTRPFDFQHHFFNQSHADIPAFLEELRQLADSYPGRFLVAEVGGEQAQEEMEMYTRPSGRLHSAYGFLYLYADRLTPDLVQEAAALWPATDEIGWPSWTFSNHDAPRAVSRWCVDAHRKIYADMALLLLVSMRGSIFIYQGEELGLPQASVPFERLQDPEAIANWPQTLGRDGARTPMPWRADARHAGFSTSEPWLPVDPAHAALAVDVQDDAPDSTLQHARYILRLRDRYASLRTGAMRVTEAGETGLLIFERGGERDAMLCVFNLSDKNLDWSLPTGWRVVERVNMPERGECGLPAYAGLLAIRET